MQLSLRPPLTSYRIGFGLPQKIGKNSRRVGKWPRTPILEPFFLFFGYFSPIFWGRPFPIFFLFFSYFGSEARNLFCSWSTGSQSYHEIAISVTRQTCAWKCLVFFGHFSNPLFGQPVVSTPDSHGSRHFHRGGYFLTYSWSCFAYS